ncbi:Inositol-3-phosphate synthase [Candidatus Desulfarcum epimagneticum]|uniref:Inositol-3-phosphate synthase n=1 Tax=uncultured Desulfobacteraceae bacterium TaxID=218296 RepID=A0A484HJJ6_9BACT|nr:Inositol-3-phosphate synthase [uncultured Desulfobacteraceae bacterium]
MSKSKIRVAVVGVGNCSKSLIEGVALYAKTGQTHGLAFADIGGYKAKNIEFVLAYDVDPRKVGKPLAEAIFAKPNCAMNFGAPENDLNAVCRGAMVKRGALYDGVAPHMSRYPKDSAFRIGEDADPVKKDIVEDLKKFQVDVLVNYLPVGSQSAAEFYVECCLEAKTPFVNCIPVFIVSDGHWEKKIKEAGILAIGDDIRSQLGASVISQALQELFLNRGLQVRFHKQTNDGGNTDFLNMLDDSRVKSKKISKENVIRSQNDIRGIPVPKNGIYAGPASYIPFQGDNKVANFRIEATGFGGAPVIFDARLSVQDSPNSAGVVIDAVRYLQVGKELGLVGSLRGPSAATQKTPPEQMMIQDAYMECRALANRRLTDSVKKNNMV